MINELLNYILPTVRALITVTYIVECIGFSEIRLQSYKIIATRKTFAAFLITFVVKIIEFQYYGKIFAVLAAFMAQGVGFRPSAGGCVGIIVVPVAVEGASGTEP